jgi:hypothetical protein
MMGAVFLGSALVSLAACAADTSEPKVAMLDSAVAQYGKTYAEWAAEWVLYSYRFAPPDCHNPLEDPSGAWCRENQREDGPVFFLAGGLGGVYRRDACVVPAGEALFFPLINTWSDNAGIADGMTVSDDGLDRLATDGFEDMDPTLLWLRVDGEDIGDLHSGAVPSTRYVLDLPPEPNRYTCAETPGYEGEYPGYVSGYWAMLAPLPPGPHTIELGAKAGVFSQIPEFQLDVRYDFIVE